MASSDDSPLKNYSVTDLNKIRQKRKILNLLHIHGYTSAPRLSHWLRISLPTCNLLLNDLISAGYVKNIGIGESNGGRKPNLYGLPEDGFFVISCDLGRYYGNMTICDCYNKFVTPVVQISTNIDDPDLVEKLYDTAQSLLKEYQIPDEKVFGVGVDMPGLIDSRAGINYTIKDEKYQHVGHNLKARFGKLIYIDNDARMHAFGEYHFGAAKGYKDAVVIHWSWGLGLGIFVNGQLYSGNNGFAGEFSHIPMVENGDLCICGKRGCLETIASSNAIIKLVRQGFKDQEISSLINQFGNHPEKITPEDVINHARQGDEFCISILNETGIAMGRGLSYIIQLINPAVIVLSGPISKGRQFVLNSIHQALNRHCLEKISGNTRILISDMGDQSALLGISEMILQEVFACIKFPEYNL